MTFKLSIVIPTYKENNNIEELIFCINKNINLNCKNFEVLIIDDDSNDGIVKTCKILKKKFYNLKLFIRRNKIRDLSQSCIYGFNKSIHQNILVMDADLQHDPIYINKMIFLFKKNNFDFVIGCRDFKNRKKVKVNFLRYLLSKYIIFLINFFLSQKTKDPMSGFFLFKKKIYIKNRNKLFGKGYKILLDLLYNSKNELTIKDIYIKFNKRLKDSSKLDSKVLLLILNFFFKKIFVKYLNLRFFNL
jgi:dolichol-phosphate mannosyltransferase